MDLSALPKSTPRSGFISTVRPTLGRERIVREARVARSCKRRYRSAMSTEGFALDDGDAVGISIELASAPGVGLCLLEIWLWYAFVRESLEDFPIRDGRV